MKMLKKGVFYAKNALNTLTDYKYTTIAGTLVFFMIMSFVPLTFFLTTILGRFQLDTDKILELQLFEWAKDLLVFFRKNAEETRVGLFFLVTTFWSSSSFFFHLRRSGEIIYRYRRKKKGWRVRFSAFLFTVLILVFLFLSAALLIGTLYLTRTFWKIFSYPIVYALLLVIGFFGAWLLNHYLCPYKISPRETAFGSLLTALSWLVASIAFAIYLSFSNKERLYGALATVIVFLLWLYWMMICFTAGAIYNCRRLQMSEKEHKRY